MFVFANIMNALAVQNLCHMCGCMYVLMNFHKYIIIVHVISGVFRCLFLCKMFLCVTNFETCGLSISYTTINVYNYIITFINTIPLTTVLIILAVTYNALL